ncbi:hypothetical protein LCGC14_2880400 [marine sediment metagenome]|uniref:Uncharacterized protein n=1 Tax=marine sediment metagenome TaxID=412755 RepID=A0A0F8Y081_9ZZZZ|nr:MAG: hypothetical protein HeimC2_35540 [Candidatus Heimdallarchaeota archaeon LC_2]
MFIYVYINISIGMAISNIKRSNRSKQKSRSANTAKATRMFQANQLKLRNKYKEKIFNFIQNNQDHTAYSISKALKHPLSSTQSIINELVSDLKIIYDEREEKGRKRKVLRVFSYDDFIFDNFNIDNLADPLAVSQMEKTLTKNYNVNIMRSDGSIDVITPEDSLTKYIEINSK